MLGSLGCWKTGNKHPAARVWLKRHWRSQWHPRVVFARDVHSTKCRVDDFVEPVLNSHLLEQRVRADTLGTPQLNAVLEPRDESNDCTEVAQRELRPPLRLWSCFARPQQECHIIMRKTVQEWLDTHHHSIGPAKKKVAGLKRLKRIPSKSTTSVDGIAIKKRRAKKTGDSATRRRPK